MGHRCSASLFSYGLDLSLVAFNFSPVALNFGLDLFFLRPRLGSGALG